jgi:hypothetical protein
MMPWFNELVHLPMFVWDPRHGGRDVRRGALAQTIDIAPTVLHFFGLDPTPDMQGRDLAQVLDDDRQVHDGALFGQHGGHVNVTDGRYVYMRAAVDPSNDPLEEYTLMPTHMRSRFSVSELADWQPASPLSFTKGLRTMRMRGVGGRMSNPFLHGTLLFDLETDPGQENPIVDDEVELRMLTLLAELMRASDAPESQYIRLGIPFEGTVTADHLLIIRQREQATATAEPMPSLDDLPAAELIATPLLQLAHTPARAVLERHVPYLLHTELVAFMPQISLFDLARSGHVSTGLLTAIAAELSTSARNGAAE